MTAQQKPSRSASIRQRRSSQKRSKSDRQPDRHRYRQRLKEADLPPGLPHLFRFPAGGTTPDRSHHSAQDAGWLGQRSSLQPGSPPQPEILAPAGGTRQAAWAGWPGNMAGRATMFAFSLGRTSVRSPRNQSSRPGLTLGFCRPDPAAGNSALHLVDRQYIHGDSSRSDRQSAPRPGRDQCQPRHDRTVHLQSRSVPDRDEPAHGLPGS